MQGILDAMRKNISKHYRGNKMIGTIAVNEVKSFFQIEEKASDIIKEEPLQGYVKNGKLFIKTIDQEIKIQIFRKKWEIISIINKKLETLWYKQRIEEIYTK